MARAVSEMHTSTICCHQLRRRSEGEDERGGWRRKNGYNRCRGKICRKERDEKVERDVKMIVKMRICRLFGGLNI